MSPRINYLDGLRGVLALIVFLHHFFYLFFPEVIFGGDYASFTSSGPYEGLKLLALTPINVLFNPGFAIHFFFLLSGYVQTQHFYQSNDTGSIQRSLLKRYFRLALPTMAVVLLVFLAHKFHWIHKELIPLNNLNKDWISTMLPNTRSFLQLFKEGFISCFQGNSRYYQILWTMPTELVNSYLVLLLALALNTLKRQTLLTLTLLLIQFFVLQEYYSIAFVTGMLLARLQITSPAFKIWMHKSWVKVLCVLMGLYFGGYPFTGYKEGVLNSVYAPISFFDSYPHIISYYIGTTFLFLFLLHSAGLQKFLSHPVLLFYGRISFMLYLLHFLLLLSISPIIYKYTHNVPITFLFSFAFTSVLSWLFNKFIDEPVVRVCNWWAKRFV